MIIDNNIQIYIEDILKIGFFKLILSIIKYIDFFIILLNYEFLIFLNSLYVYVCKNVKYIYIYIYMCVCLCVCVYVCVCAFVCYIL